MPLAPLSLAKHFATLKDPRRKHGRLHSLLDLLTIAFCAVLCGCDTWPEVETFAQKRRAWLRRFLRLPHGTPSHDTFERVFDRLDAQALQRCLQHWLRSLGAVLPIHHIAIDGKTARRSGSAVRQLAPLQLVSAWATEQGLSLGQVAVDADSNEITAVPQLLALLDLHGALVTLDALHCQKEVAAKVVAGGGDYLLVVKDNQPHLRDDVEACFLKAFDVDLKGIDFTEYRAEEWGHGRRELRHYLVLNQPEGIRDREAWAGLRVVGLCHREREVNGQVSHELHYFIGSRAATARTYGEALRNHWRIENNLHWQLDVTFDEDQNRIRKRVGAINAACLRRLALSLLKLHPGKASIARKRLAAALDPDFLEEILTPARKLVKA
jgi:predicted transposase YbfD/YdcC